MSLSFLNDIVINIITHNSLHTPEDKIFKAKFQKEGRRPFIMPLLPLLIILENIVSNCLPSSNNMRDCCLLYSLASTGYCILSGFPFSPRAKAKGIIMACEVLPGPPYSCTEHRHAPTTRTLHSLALPRMLSSSDICITF